LPTTKEVQERRLAQFKNEGECIAFVNHGPST
jgi:hypothetical protein